MSVTERLRTSELFKFSNASHSSASWQAERAYLRASAIAEAYGLSLDDVLSLTPGFWDMHADPTLCWDGAATTILTIQYNLTIGTVGRLAENQNREDLLPLLDDLLKFRTIGQFCLTEVGHGLDAVNLETTATLLEDGTFDLHTPTPAAAKFMPPMVPVLGRPCIAVVFAQLIVGKEKRGIRPFLVNINDGRHMCSGITTKLLPHRNGSFPVNHGITSFRHVRLPRGALLAEDVEKSPSEHFDFLMRIWRVSVGTLSLSLVAMSTLKIASHIAFFYSKRRTVGGPENSRVPILSFRTQQIPVFTAVARAYVLDAFSRRAIQLFMDDSLDIRVRHGIATCFKAATLHCAQESAILLSERCGAQGLFGHNQIVTQYSEMRGIAIAEGDILVLSIRLATELILGRYSMPHSDNSRSLLSKHEAGIMAECQSLTTQYGHRSEEFATRVLPKCQFLVETIGHRIAYDAAVAEGVPAPLIAIYEADVIKKDLAWFVEDGCISRATFDDMEVDAINRASHQMEEWVNGMKTRTYVTAPITSADRWDDFVAGLETFSSVRRERRPLFRASL